MLVLFSMMPQTDKIQVYMRVNFLLQMYVFKFCGDVVLTKLHFVGIILMSHFTSKSTGCHVTDKY